MQDVESVTAKLDIQIDIEEKEKTVVDFVVDMKLQEKSEKNFLTAMDMKIKYGSVNVDFDAYLDFNDTNFTMYMKNFVTNDQYIKINQPIENMNLSEENQKLLEGFLNLDIEFNPNINELDSDIEDTRKLEVTVTNNEIKNVLKQYEEYIKGKDPDYEVFSEYDLKEIENIQDIRFIVYIDNNYYLKKIEIDLKSMVENIVNKNALEGNEIKINSLKMNYEFSDYNKTTVEIPQEVIDNAVEETLEEDYYLEDYNI